MCVLTCIYNILDNVIYQIFFQQNYMDEELKLQINFKKLTTFHIKKTVLYGLKNNSLIKYVVKK